MEFKQVIQICLDFAIANGGTIQSYPAGTPDRLRLDSLTSRTKIFIGRDPTAPKKMGSWEVLHVQDASGVQASARRAGVSTEHDLLEFIREFWTRPTQILRPPLLG